MIFLRKHWLIILILVVSLALCLYRIDLTMTFLEDDGRDLLFIKRMIDTGRPVLLGPQTSTGNMYLGPLYYYFITPALILARMNPVGPSILIALTGVLTVFLLYYLGKKWFSNSAGYLAALMFAVLPFSVAVTRASWNPNLVPLIATLMLVVYDKLIYGRPTYWAWFTFGLLTGAMIQLHYMTLIYCGVLSLGLSGTKNQLIQLLRGVAVAFIGLVLSYRHLLFLKSKQLGQHSRDYSLSQAKKSATFATIFQSGFGGTKSVKLIIVWLGTL